MLQSPCNRDTTGLMGVVSCRKACCWRYAKPLLMIEASRRVNGAEVNGPSYAYRDLPFLSSKLIPSTILDQKEGVLTDPAK